MQKEAKNIFLVSWNEAKRKGNGFCFASFRFQAKKYKKRKWDTLKVAPPAPLLTI